jgi:trimethylamine--corrinoid protein Co-methyltransferase
MSSNTPDLITFPTIFSKELLSADQMDEFKQATLHILEHVGAIFPSKRALTIFEEHGANVDWDKKLVRIPPDLVIKAMSTAPRSFVLAGREERFDLTLDGKNSYLCTDGCGVHVIDPYTREKRSSTKADVALAAKVSDALPMISFFWPPVSAQDFGKTAPLHECHAGLTNTLKHVRGGTTVLPGLAPYVVELALAVRESKEALRARPPICANICTIAPLTHDADGLETALVYAEAGIPVSFMAMPTMASTAPATPLGALVQGDAEVISAMVLIQLAYPGAPVFHSIVTSLMEPRTGGYIGDLALPLSRFSTQIAHAWNVPSIEGGSLATNAASLGWRSGAESGMGAMQIPLAAGEICGFASLLDNSMILSPAKLILDHELCGDIHEHFYGFEFKSEDFALDVIADVGPGSHFLRHKHTRQHLRDHRFSKMYNQQDEKFESRDPVDVAFEEFIRIAENHQPEPLPDATLKEMDVILATAAKVAEKIG